MFYFIFFFLFIIIAGEHSNKTNGPGRQTEK